MSLYSLTQKIRDILALPVKRGELDVWVEASQPFYFSWELRSAPDEATQILAQGMCELLEGKGLKPLLELSFRELDYFLRDRNQYQALESELISLFEKVKKYFLQALEKVVWRQYQSQKADYQLNIQFLYIAIRIASYSMRKGYALETIEFVDRQADSIIVALSHDLDNREKVLEELEEEFLEIFEDDIKHVIPE